MRSWAHVTIQQPKVGDTISLNPPSKQRFLIDYIIENASKFSIIYKIVVQPHKLSSCHENEYIFMKNVKTSVFASAILGWL